MPWLLLPLFSSLLFTGETFFLLFSGDFFAFLMVKLLSLNLSSYTPRKFLHLWKCLNFGELVVFVSKRDVEKDIARMFDIS